ncbi:hypothetical protein T492DRAFT_935198 [Pavlovales sp. CCMP2436]|nr:hypothetical protein T492DRAFT_935198 [Pavlovales sp. CCMP2436]|mmetsp:Transcript_11264/g.28465  ORF Transcript_11264/g.28465 Transcript_11264/m.28465 type:complete len:209 (+) Transcript_11264:165-791(+)
MAQYGDPRGMARRPGSGEVPRGDAQQYGDEPVSTDPTPSPRTQFMWADDLFAYLDSVELSLGEENQMRDSGGDPSDADGHARDEDMLGIDANLDPAIASRRAKNRLSAQLSRRRKKQYISCLEARLRDLHTVNCLLDDSLMATKAQNKCLQRDLVQFEGRMEPVMTTDDTDASKRARHSGDDSAPLLMPQMMMMMPPMMMVPMGAPGA